MDGNTSKSAFTIGGHSVSKALFGLRKSQVVGVMITASFGFFSVIALNGPEGIAVLVVVTLFGSLGFLVGYRRLTLDLLILLLVNWAKERKVQKVQEHRFDVFGFTKPPSSPGFVLSLDRDKSLRISETTLGRSANANARMGRRVGIRNLHHLAIDESRFLGIGTDVISKKAVFALETFGDSFLYKDEQDQFDAAYGFGKLLGTLAGLPGDIESITVLFSVQPKPSPDNSADLDAWSPELAELYGNVCAEFVYRRSFIIVRLARATVTLSDYREQEEFLRTLDMSFRPLAPGELVELLAFGAKYSHGNGGLHLESHWNYLSVADRVSRLFEVTGLPMGEIRPDFLAPFIVSLSSESLFGFRLNILDNRYALRKIRAKRSGITADAGLRSLFGFLSKSSEVSAIESLEFKEQELDMGYQMFSVSGYLALFADDVTRLERDSADVVAKARRVGLVLDCAYGQQMRSRRRLFGSLG